MCHPDARPCRIVAAVPGRSVEGGADDLASPATVAFIQIHFYRFDDFLCFLTHDGYHLFT
jgi:hypothetical protein